jgi:catechol 2,3-dioxygenase-like lactoylglutathione lyase family enzyme
MTDMPRLWLRSIDFAGPAVPETVGFYEELWKLAPAHREAGVVWLRGTGNEPYLLGLHERARRGLVRISLGVADRAALEAAHRALTGRGARVLGSIGELSTPGGGIGFELVDPDHRVLRLCAALAPAAPGADADAPRKLSHVVLNSTDLDGALTFYTETLGLRVSDWSENQMVFLRCGSDHHSIAFNRADRNSINHVAFELPTIDAFMRGIGRMKNGGYPVNWGPGRHGPGNNPFAYFIGPSGFVVEYTTDIQQIDEATHQPKVWKRTPEESDRWMSAGPPSRQMRVAMAGDPDPGLEN